MAVYRVEERGASCAARFQLCDVAKRIRCDGCREDFRRLGMFANGTRNKDSGRLPDAVVIQTVGSVSSRLASVAKF